MANASSLNSKLIKEIKKKKFLKRKDHIKGMERTLRHNFLKSIYVPGNNGILQEFKKEEYLKNDELMKYIYSDKSIVFHAERNQHQSSISQPSLISAMLELLDLKKGEKVFEIGTGSCYNATIMSHIVGKTGFVFSTELDNDIYEIAKENLRESKIKNIYIDCKDGGFGLDEFAPYDKIIVTCATADITKYWIDQLKIGGIIVCPLITRGMEVIVRFKKVRENYLEGTLHYYVHFYNMGGIFSILFHYTYTKRELKTMNKIIKNYAVIDEEISEKINKLNRQELNDFYLYLSLKNKNSICYFESEVGESKRGYGIFLKGSAESGIAIIFDKNLYIWGNPDAHYMMINEFEKFIDSGSPNISKYKLRVYSDANDIYESSKDIVISRKNSTTVFEMI